jgi:hypothetical protein
MVWVRSLDSLDARALAGTEGASYALFWSPDGRSIGFATQGKLKRVEAAGGPPQTLCENANIVLGGSWNRDGTIIFSSNAGGLYRVAQAGGPPAVLTKSDEAHGEIGHLRPWFLPDGTHFLYVTRMAKSDDDAIYLASLDNGERKRLVSSKQAGAYAPPAPGAANGHLLFLREATLMAQPIDNKKFELVGDPFPVAEDVGSYLALGYFGVSANGVLAWREGSEGQYGSRQLAWFDRTGKKVGTLGSVFRVAAPQLPRRSLPLQDSRSASHGNFQSGATGAQYVGIGEGGYSCTRQPARAYGCAARPDQPRSSSRRT